MSFFAGLDERERARREQDKALKEYLKLQNEETKRRKALERQTEINEYRRLIGTVSSAAPAAGGGAAALATSGSSIAAATQRSAERLSAQTAEVGLRRTAAASSAMQLLTECKIPYLPPRTTTTLLGGSLLPTAIGGPSAVQSLWTGPASPASSSSTAKNSSFQAPSFGVPPASQQQQQQQQDHQTQQMPLPTPLTSAMPVHNSLVTAADELLSKLRFSEEQLQLERRSRSWLESELNAGKTMLATLAARVDKLQDSTTADAATIRELSRQVAESDQRAREAAAQLASRMERDSSKLHQLVADIAGRQQSEERTIRDQDDRFRAAAEAINQMRYTTEASLLKANQVGNEFYAKAKDWEAEMRRGAESMRAIKDHEQALESLHTTVSATTETLARRTESALGEIRQRIDADARFRGQFEDSIRGVCAEIRRVIQSQERDLIDRVESLRQAAAAGVERVRQENAAALADRLEQQHQHEREVRDSQALLLEKVSQQLLAVDAILGDERQARRTLEAQLQTTLEEGFKLMQTAIAKRFGEVVENHQELKASVAQVTRSLQDSVFLVEKTLEGKIASVEEVLRAEIKSRMETDSAVSGLAEELTLKLDHSERKLAARIDEGIAESAREHDALVNETRETVAQVSKSIASAAADADTQLSALAGRIGESTRAVRDEIKALAANAAGIESDLRAAIDQAQAKMASESDRLESLVAENGAKMKGVDAACRELRVHVDERINLRGAQLDAALEAFKTELASRATKAEFADLSHLATTEDQRARTLIESLQKQVSELGASLDRHVSRTDLEDARAEIRLEVASAQEKAAHVEERLLQMSSDMATRISADTLVETESRLRESMRAIHERVSENDQQLQTMRSGLEERATNDMVSEVKTELAHRVLEQQQRIQHFATEIQGLREAFAAMPARADLEHVSASVTEQISSLVHSLNKLDSAQKAALASATERLDAQLASIGKREEDNHAKTQEAMSNINGQIESLEASAALLRQELAARIDTNTAAIEDKAHQLKEAIDAARQMADERLVEFSRRTDGISLSLSELSQHVTDAKQAAQLAAAESERREESAIQELRSVVAGLAQQKLVDELHSELDAVVDKLSSRIDIAMLTFEQQRQRMSDHEQANKDRWREMASANERSIRDSQQAIKSAREALSSRLASMEALVHEATKRAESSGADVKKLKADIQGPLAHTMHALERDVSLVKEDMRRCVVEREVMAIVATATRSVEARIDRVQDNISDLRREIEVRTPQEPYRHRRSPSQERLRDNAGGSGAFTQEPPRIVPSSFYKPAHVAFGDSKPIEPAAPRRLQSPRRSTASLSHLTGPPDANSDAMPSERSDTAASKPVLQALPTTFTGAGGEF